MKQTVAALVVVMMLAAVGISAAAGEVELRGGVLVGSAGIGRTLQLATEQRGVYVGGELNAARLPIAASFNYWAISPDNVDLLGLAQLNLEADTAVGTAIGGWRLGPAVLGGGWASARLTGRMNEDDVSLRAQGPVLGGLVRLAASERLHLGGEFYYAPSVRISASRAGVGLQVGNGGIAGAELRAAYGLGRTLGLEAGYRISKVIDAPLGINMSVGGLFAGGRLSF